MSNGLSERLVEEVDELKETLLEFVSGGEAPALEQPTGEDTEPDLDLIEPGTVLGRINKADAMGGILEKGGPGGHALENPGLSLATEIAVDPTALGDAFDQTGRLVGVELINDEDPLAQRIGVHGALDVCHKIGFGAGVADGGRDEAPGGDLQIGD